MSDVQFQNLVRQCQCMSEQMVQITKENKQLRKENKLLIDEFIFHKKPLRTFASLFWDKVKDPSNKELTASISKRLKASTEYNGSFTVVDIQQRKEKKS